MLRRYKLKKKMLCAIKLLRVYFISKDMDVYSALCNVKMSNILINKKKYVKKKITGEVDLICQNKEKTVCVDFHDGFVYKVLQHNKEEMIEVENFRELIGLDNNTMCTLDMVIDYLRSRWNQISLED